MPFNGSGTFVPLTAPDYPAVTGTTISATAFNNYTTDLMANGLSKALVRDGQAAMTGNLNLGGFRITNLAAPVAGGDAATLADVSSKVARAGDTMTGALSILTSAGGRKLELRTDTTTSGNDAIALLHNRGGGAGTTPYYIGGLWGAAYRDILDPAYVAGIDFVRLSAFGGLSSGGEIVFYTLQDGETFAAARGTPQYAQMRIDSAGNVILRIPLGVGSGGTGATTAAAARANLGCGSAATNATADFANSVNLGVSNPGAARANLGLGSAATNATADFANSTNLGTLTSPSGARANLGLGSIATANVTASAAGPSGGVDGDIWLRY